MSDESLRYFYPPYIEAPGASIQPPNLTHGFESWQRSDDSVDGHLDALLQTLQAHEERLLGNGATAENARTRTDIVTWRGMMTKILTTAFDAFSDFEMNATCYQGTIYIEENHAYSFANKQQQNGRPPRHGEMSQDMMQFCGYKFESLSVLPRPWADVTRDEIEQRDRDIVNNNEQYCAVVRTGIGGTSLVLAGEIDCIRGGKPDDMWDATTAAGGGNVPWLELKTTAEPADRGPREAQKYERKLLRFWAQSFLLGVPTVVVGFRSPDGYLTSMRELDVQKIPGQVAKGEGTWNGNVCINVTAAFLDFLKAMIMDTEGVWRIKRLKNDRHIRIHKVLETGTGRILLPEFKAHREKLMAAAIAAKLGGASAGLAATTAGQVGAHG